MNEYNKPDSQFTTCLMRNGIELTVKHMPLFDDTVRPISSVPAVRSAKTDAKELQRALKAAEFRCVDSCFTCADSHLYQNNPNQIICRSTNTDLVEVGPIGICKYFRPL